MAEIGFVSTVQFDRAGYYKALHADRLVDEVPVNTGANEVWTPVLRLRFDNISTDEMFMVSGSVEGTNDTGHSINLVAKIVVNSNYDDEPGDNGAFVISAGGGGNTSTARHHELLLRPAIWVPGQNYGQRNITLMVRGVSSAAQQGDVATLTSAPAELKVLRFYQGAS